MSSSVRKEAASIATSTHQPHEAGPALLPLPAGGACGSCALWIQFYKAWGDCHSPEVKAFEINRQGPRYRARLRTKVDAMGRPYHETFVPLRHREDGCRYYEVIF